MWFLAKVFKMSMTEVQLPHSAVYPPGSKGSRHGPYNGDKLMSMSCSYTNCVAEPSGRAEVVTAAQVLVKKQANRVSTQGGLMAQTTAAALHRELEANGVLSGPNLHALARPARPLQGSAEVIMDKEFQVREFVVFMMQFEV